MILTTCSVLIMFSIQNVQAMPYMSPQDLYKASDMVFHGQVISKQTGPGPDYYYYQVKVDTFFKNPQTSDSITVAGHKSEGGHVSYPQFEMGDTAIFYINKTDGINTISPYSQIAGNACNVQSFLESSPISANPKIGPAPSSHIYIEDAKGVMPYIPLINHTAVFHDDDVWNIYPESRMVPITLSIRVEYDGQQQVFNQTQTLEMQACSGPGKVQWNFVPTKVDNYIATVSDDKSKIAMSFNSVYNYTADSIISPPLKQFKSGVAPKDVKCNDGFLLTFKAEDGSPVCVKPETAKKLYEHGWASVLTIRIENNIPLNYTQNVHMPYTNENKTSSPLQLFLSVDSEYQNPAEPVTINIGLNNTGSVPLTIAKSDNWPRNDMSSGLCSNLPFGISILKGYYTEQNMSSAKSLVIYGLVPCPLPTVIKSYTFDPLSNKATQECDSLFSCPGLTDMKAHLVIPDFMYNGQHHSFDVGKYTVVGGDEWGHVLIKHFVEEYATAYSNPLEHD